MNTSDLLNMDRKFGLLDMNINFRLLDDTALNSSIVRNYLFDDSKLPYSFIQIWGFFSRSKDRLLQIPFELYMHDKKY